MSEHTLHVKVVTPDGVVFGHETASLVVLDTINGEEGIMANHAPIITSLHIGEVKVINEEENFQENITISGGLQSFLKINYQSFLTVQNVRKTLTSSVLNKLKNVLKSI